MQSLLWMWFILQLHCLASVGYFRLHFWLCALMCVSSRPQLCLCLCMHGCNGARSPRLQTQHHIRLQLWEEVEGRRECDEHLCPPVPDSCSADWVQDTYRCCVQMCNVTQMELRSYMTTVEIALVARLNYQRRDTGPSQSLHVRARRKSLCVAQMGGPTPVFASWERLPAAVTQPKTSAGGDPVIPVNVLLFFIHHSLGKFIF